MSAKETERKKKKISTKNMDKAIWLGIRRSSIGGSDVGTILGFNKYKSAYQLWLDKTGQIEIDTDSPSDAAYLGTALEPFVAKEFEVRTDKRVRVDNHMYFHKDYPFLSANVDRQIVGENAILECKTASPYLADKWEGDNIPEQYIFQIQHYMNVLDKDYAYVCALIWPRIIWKRVERDQELIDIMQERLINFWENNVVKNIAPPIDGSSATTDFLKERFSSFDQGKQIELGSREDELIRTLNEQKVIAEEVKENIAQIENQIKNELGKEDAEIAVTPKNIIKWKAITSNRIDSKKLKEEQPEIFEKYVKSNSYRKFKIEEIK